MNDKKIIRAVFNDKTVLVYQAYNKEIAQLAVRRQTFVSPPFKLNRMTWIKPSFFWMMYRSGWATKSDQEHILAITITREGFEWALQHACLSHFDPKVHASHDAWKKLLAESRVCIQWDPERDRYMNKLNYRSIQIGLSGESVSKYVNEWIVKIEDITERCRQIHTAILNQHLSDSEIQTLLPDERIYNVDYDFP